MKKLVTYPRGFVGFVREGFNTDSVVTTPESLNINKVLSAARFNQQIQNAVSAKTFNSSVTELWTKYRENNKNFSDMKFREEVLVSSSVEAASNKKPLAVSILKNGDRKSVV
jgi:hypothetical protein